MAEEEKKEKRKKRKKFRKKVIIQGVDNVQDFKITQPLSFTQSSEPVKTPEPAATKGQKREMKIDWAKQKREIEELENELKKLRDECYATLARLYPKSKITKKLNYEEVCQRQVRFPASPYLENGEKYFFFLRCPRVDKGNVLQGCLRYFPHTQKYKLMEGSIISDIWESDDKPLDKTAKLFFDDNRDCFLLKEDDKYKCERVKTPEEKKTEKLTNTKRIYRSSTPIGTVRYFQVMKDLEVSSPSLAATLVVGYKRNGRKSWKNYKGKSIEDLGIPNCERWEKRKKKNK